MANVKVCDICGEECKDNGRYELLYKCILSIKKHDVCFKCMRQLKNNIRDAKEKESEHNLTEKDLAIQALSIIDKHYYETKQNIELRQYRKKVIRSMGFEIELQEAAERMGRK